MRYIKLVSSLVIGFGGIIFYFLTVPSIDTDNFLTVEVEAGDKSILKNVYLSGSLDSGNHHYSNFIYQPKDKDLLITEELPFLQKIDDPYTPEIKTLLEKYPEFISDIHYDTNQMVTQYGESDNYLAAAYFDYERADYSPSLEILQFELFNKETKEIQKEKIKRTENLEGVSADIYAIHENYPIVKVLFSTSDWNANDYTTNSTLLLGEYNVETKKYSEKVVKKITGDFMYNEVGMNVTNNEELALIPFYLEENIMNEEDSIEIDTQEKMMIVDLITSETMELKFEPHYLVSNQGELYSFTQENNSAFLRKYDEQFQEVVDTISLELESFDLDKNSELVIVTKIIDEHLFIIQNEVDYEGNKNKPTSALFQVFNLKSGKEISKGKLKFDQNNPLVSQTYVDTIEKNK